MESSRDTPENLLSAALRAQAVGGQPGNAVPAPPPPPPPVGPPERRRLPVGAVLLFAVLLGVAAGGISGLLTVV
ncbi:hypothetical protein GCM10027271_11970 [Saccharopolyspora gloriosae]|uniref:Uncharacterized protein n=1 Tax=Saccharopolyspora gloriosae TaxID=455344 RepID=A0A840NJJ5_9PSEU|nr:hypothetical protein [Saccharopolyspora gloriosae]MBB5072736.1 hypothetical protein [Saccharopolyspora gloriosae]